MAKLVCILNLLLSSLSGFVSTLDCPPLPDSPGCTCQSDAGVIDLTSIASESKDAQFSVYSDNGVYYYEYNPCYGIVTSGCTDPTTAVCQYDSSIGAYVVVSEINGEKIVVEGDTYFLQYVGGADGRTANVKLICDESQTTPTFAFDTEDTGLIYNFELTSMCACPDGCGDAGPPTGSIDIELDISGPIGLSIMFLFMASVVGYFIVGVLVMKFRYNRHGYELVPQREFWFALPFLIKDGFMFTFSPCLSRAGIDCGKTRYNAL